MAHDPNNAGFELHYKFKQPTTVLIRHPGGKFLRVRPQDEDEADRDGGRGKLAQWDVKLHDNDKVQFQNKHTGKFLRIHKHNEVDVGGVGGKFTFFKLHPQNIGFYKLQSVEHPKHYIAVQKDKQPSCGSGGAWCRFEFLREGRPEPFSKPYMFALKREVLIQHRGHAFLRVDGPQDKHDVHTNGGRGEFARFEAEPMDGGKEVKLKSMKNGHYLRIHKGIVDCGGAGGPFTVFKVHPVEAPNHVRLESKKHHGEFVSVDWEKGHCHVTDGKNKQCLLTLTRKND